ncbi:DUF4184 family protein [Flavobacterium humi]|uniref:DUF4184 family protein n=1 Tax=Flavobacterium humi TaxID=2562683 RepID=A0A4Z0LDA0_9FLAO|nr:DUF4184 family protein [Flavobacterium humi]TGD59892.1 DUF4184 family protein [Flavobacterium humi]
MPFTFSHPAIVLPLTYLPRRWFSLTGLVIGSLTPDFEYFIRMKVQSNYSHTLSGLFWFDIPLGLLLAFIFHNFVRESLIDNLPTILKSRLSSFSKFNWNKHFKKNWAVIIISALIGAISHLFWDSFTHVHGYFVEIIPMLTNKIDILGMQIPVFKILQHSSTLLGGIIISVALLKLPINKNITGGFSFKYWSIVVGLTLAIIFIRFSTGLDYKAYGQLIVTGISAVLISLVFTPWLVRQINGENNNLV